MNGWEIASNSAAKIFMDEEVWSVKITFKFCAFVVTEYSEVSLLETAICCLSSY